MALEFSLMFSYPLVVSLLLSSLRSRLQQTVNFIFLVLDKVAEERNKGLYMIMTVRRDLESSQMQVFDGLRAHWPCELSLSFVFVLSLADSGLKSLITLLEGYCLGCLKMKPRLPCPQIAELYFSMEVSKFSYKWSCYSQVTIKQLTYICF